MGERGPAYEERAFPSPAQRTEMGRRQATNTGYSQAYIGSTHGLSPPSVALWKHRGGQAMAPWERDGQRRPLPARSRWRQAMGWWNV